MTALTFPGYVAAQLAYDRRSTPGGRWHSEVDRQARIDKLAIEICADLIARLRTQSSDAGEIGADYFGCLELDECATLVRLAESDQQFAHDLLIELIRAGVRKAARNAAECRAIRAFEAGE